MRTLVVRSAALLALLPLGGCPLFSAGIDVPEMCVTLHDRKVQGVAPGQDGPRIGGFGGSPRRPGRFSALARLSFEMGRGFGRQAGREVRRRGAGWLPGHGAG